MEISEVCNQIISYGNKAWATSGLGGGLLSGPFIGSLLLSSGLHNINIHILTECALWRIC